MNSNYGNYSFGAYSLLTDEEKALVRGAVAVELFNGKDAAMLRSRAERQAQIGESGLSTALFAAASRLEAGMVPYFIQAKAATESAESVAHMEEAARKGKALPKALVDHCNQHVARALKLIERPVFFA